MTGPDLDFTKFYDNFQAKIRRYLTRMVGEDEAEELTQEVFLKASQGLKDFRGASSLSTWIYRIATNTAIDRLRRPSGKKPADLSLSDASISETIKPVDENHTGLLAKVPLTDQQVIRKEMNDCIKSYIEGLPEPYRTVLVLADLEGFKNREVADILQVSLPTVKIRLHRARGKLREELTSHCTLYRDERNELACDLKHAMETYRKSD
jgi:RNA polymerase sigma-70 factor (ECF subfamily)